MEDLFGMQLYIYLITLVAVSTGMFFGYTAAKLKHQVIETKQENEDKEYCVNYDFRNDNIIRLTDVDFKNHICENNQSFAIYDDAMTANKIIRCKNKPRDLPMFGVTFKEKQ